MNIRTGLVYGQGKDANGAHFMLLTDTVNAIFRVEDNLPIPCFIHLTLKEIDDPS